MTSCGLAAAHFGIHDVLLEKAIRAAIVGGVSLGGLVSATIAGSLTRASLMSFLRGSQPIFAPNDENRPESAAVAFLPPEPGSPDDEWFYGDHREGVYLGGDSGLGATKKYRAVLLSGYLDALRRLEAEVPGGRVVVTEEVDIAVHSPLRVHAQEATRQIVQEMEFADPVLPLCCWLEQRTIKTGAEVRELFVRNVVQPVSIVPVYEEMKRNGTRLALIVGPTVFKDTLSFPFPVVHVDRPEAISAAVGAIFEYGAGLPGE